MSGIGISSQACGRRFICYLSCYFIRSLTISVIQSFLRYTPFRGRDFCPSAHNFYPSFLQNFHSDIESALQRGCYVLLIDVDLAMLKENKKLHEMLKAHDQFINADAPFKLTVRKLFHFQNCLTSVNGTF